MENSALLPTHQYSFGGEWKTIEPPISRSRLAFEEPRKDYQQAKAKYDTNGSRFWRVHNKLYDLNDYIHLHPGGHEWIEFTRGTDCTEAFEAHHLNMAKVEKVLSAYYVKDADDGGLAEELSLTQSAVSPDDVSKKQETTSKTIKIRTDPQVLEGELKRENGVSRGRALTEVETEDSTSKQHKESESTTKSSRIFLYDSADFYSTLRKRVKAELLRKTGAKSVMEATGPSKSMKLACAVVVSQFLVVHSLAARTGSKILSSLAGLCLIGCWGVGHNFMHQSDSQAGYWRYAIDLTPLSSHAQRMTHALSHHLYPNMHCDIECYDIEDLLVAFIPGVNKDNRMPVRKSYPLVLFMAGAFGWLQKLGTFCSIMKSKGFSKMSLGEKANFLPVLQLLNYIRYNGLKQGLKLFSLQMGIFLMVFTPIGLSVHHSVREDEESNNELKPAAWHEGMADPQKNFGEHQVVATSDHTVDLNDGSFLGNYLSLIFFAYLNDHTGHHLFPSIDHSKHSLYRETMMKTFEDFNVPYRTNNFWVLLAGFHTFIQTRNVREISSDLQNIG